MAVAFVPKRRRLKVHRTVVPAVLLALTISPAIERIWLKDTLSPEAVEEHQALEQGQLGA